MQDNNFPIIYLDLKGLMKFSQTSEDSLMGCFYEWEGEGVYHLYAYALSHQFGHMGKVLFTKGEMPEAQAMKGVKFLVKTVAGVCEYSVYENVEDKWVPREVSPICVGEEFA